jgi:hypothetical protein
VCCCFVVLLSPAGRSFACAYAGASAFLQLTITTQLVYLTG